MEKQAWEIFNELEHRYRKAYESVNGKKVIKLGYTSGWVCLATLSDRFTTKIRVKKFEQMTKELERRLEEKK